MFVSRFPRRLCCDTTLTRSSCFSTSTTLASLTSSRPDLEKVRPNDAFRYTSGRWLYNETKRLEERKLQFDISALAQAAAASVGRDEADVQSIEKLAEGGFNRAFRIGMRDGFEMIGRLPYPSTQPKSLAVASEVATMKYIGSNGVPVPKIYGYSCDATNPVGTEYILMENVRGKRLGDVWFTLSDKEIVKVLAGIVDIEVKLFDIDFPAYGSIYEDHDLPKDMERTPIRSGGLEPYCVGPDVSLRFWSEERSNIDVRRGPSMSALDLLHRAAIKEKVWLHAHGKPRFPFDRAIRDINNYEKSDPCDHLQSLDMYLQVASQLVPKDKWLHRPTLRHPDLKPNNIFVSDDLEITGIIDWQHSNILPLFLNAGVPTYLQDYRDPESDNLIKPQIAANFEELNDKDQAEELRLYRRRFIHYSYAEATARKLDLHFEAMMYENKALRRRIYQHASEAWEGNNIPLKADLVLLCLDWKELASQATDVLPPPPCPMFFDERVADKILGDMAMQEDAEEEVSMFHEAIGIGSDGWVPHERYEEAAAQVEELKALAIEDAKDDFERELIIRHWPWDDHDEKE